MTYRDLDPQGGDSDNNLLAKILLRLKTLAGGGGGIATDVTATLTVSDIEIGAVELKDSASNNRATITGAGAVKVDGSAVTQPVSGSVAVTNFPASQSVVGGGTEAAAQRVTIANDSTGLLSVDDNGGSLTVDGSVAVTNFPATQPVSGTVAVSNFPASLSVVGGGTEATALRVTVANDSTGVLSVDDNGGSLTVDTPQLPAALVGGRLDVNIGASGATVPVSIAATVGVNILPATTGGYTTFHLVSAASTNATNIKASAGQVFGWFLFNNHATLPMKVAFHNTAGTPTAGAGIFFTIPIPAGSGANVFTETGIAFSTGIAITTVTGLADADATSVAVNDLIINIWYK